MHTTKAAATTVTLTFPSEVRLVDFVHNAAERMAELAGFDSDDALNVGLAVREAVINAIVHGNGRDPALDVRVNLRIDDGLIEASIKDRGAGFDPDAAPDPTDPENILRTSGRGLLLIRAFVDELRFRRDRRRGMQVILTKRRRA